MRNFARIILVLGILICANPIYAQIIPSIEWQKCLGGSSGDGASSIQETTDGGFIVAGYSSSNDGDVSGNHGDQDFWVVRLDKTGNLVWQKSLGGSDDDGARSVQQTTDGSFIVAGFSYSHDGDVTGFHGAQDMWVAKLDTSGNLIWQKSLGGADDEEALSARETTDNGFIVAGWSDSNNGDVSGNHGNSDCWIVKLDASGNLEWQNALGGSLGDYFASVQQTVDGGYIVIGETESIDFDVSGNHGATDYWIVKLDTVGKLIWRQCLGGDSVDRGYSIQQINEGGFIDAGYSVSNNGNVSGNHGANDYWIGKLDTIGNLIWQKSLGGSSDDQAYEIQQTTDAGFIVGGFSLSNDGDVTGAQGNADYWIVKLDTDGNLVWQKSLGGTLDDWAYSIQQITDGGFIVAGMSKSNDGDVSANHGAFDYWIVKLSSDATSIASLSSNLISLYPNPVQSQLTINLAALVNDATVYVYDVQGRMIVLPTSDFKSHTSNSIRLNTENLPAGFYTLQIVNGTSGECEVWKFVKQ